jgi:hypothetical protein
MFFPPKNAGKSSAKSGSTAAAPVSGPIPTSSNSVGVATASL